MVRGIEPVYLWPVGLQVARKTVSLRTVEPSHTARLVWSSDLGCADDDFKMS